MVGTAAVAVREADSTLCASCGGASVLLHPGRSEAGAAAVPGRYRIARMEYGTPYPVRRCTACGLGWAEVPHHRPEVLAAYAENQEEAYTEEERSRRETFRRGLERVRRHAPPGPQGRLLDVGAATGFLLVEARALGYGVLGLEPSRWAAAEARRRFGLEVRTSDLESAALEAASFDVVTLVDVIEHFVDPFAALAEVRRVLRPGGHVYLVTPDLASLAARLLGRRWWGFEPWHLWYFDRRSLERALAAHGFEVVAARGYARRFSLGYWLKKAEGLSRPLAAPLRRLAEAFGLAGRSLSVDLHDTLEVIARREG